MGPWFVGAGGVSLDQLGVVGHGLLIWDPGLFLCLLDNSCQSLPPRRPYGASSILQSAVEGRG